MSGKWDCQDTCCNGAGRELPVHIVEVAEESVLVECSQSVVRVCEHYITEADRVIKEKLNTDIVQAPHNFDDKNHAKLLQLKQCRMPESSAASTEPKLPSWTASIDLMNHTRKENAPLGLFCHHKHCFAHVPFGTHGHQAA